MVNGFSIPFLGIKHLGILPYQSVRVFGDFVQFVNVDNPGIAFGWYFGSSFKAIMVLLTIAAVTGLVYYLHRVKDREFKFRLGIAMIIGGACGNLIDRVFYGVFYHYAPLLYGRVIDFIQIRIFEISLFGRSYNHFPIFNIADIGITLGVLYLLLFYKNIEAGRQSVNVAEDTSVTDENAEKSAGGENENK